MSLMITIYTLYFDPRFCDILRCVLLIVTVSKCGHVTTTNIVI